MEPEGSLPHSQLPPTCPNSEPAWSSPYSHIPLPKLNLYLANSLATVLSDTDLYKFLTFHVPNLISLFHCLGCTKGSVQALGNCSHFVMRPVFMVGRCCYLAQPQAGWPPLVGCLWLLIRYIHSYTPYWRPFLHLQLEDTPYDGDRDSLIMDISELSNCFVSC